MKSYKPTTASRRHMTTRSYKKVVTVSSPFKSLTKGGKRGIGRNHSGRITSRHRGGGHKRKYRQIDFTFNKKEIPARVEAVEYDPNRSAYIALLCYNDGERRYIIAHTTVKVGDVFIASETAKPLAGTRMPMHQIPIGAQIHNIELKPGAGAKLARSAGAYATIIAQDGTHTHLKMASTEVRKVNSNAWATIGVVSNEEHQLLTIGKAGRSRWLGIRPTVRGTAMNPVDHPHGGGEGRQGRGHRRARSIFGRPTGKGHKTRKPNKYSDASIVSRRKVGKRKEPSN
jgi:large subunit ribosomal protein L2